MAQRSCSTLAAWCSVSCAASHPPPPIVLVVCVSSAAVVADPYVLIRLSDGSLRFIQADEEDSQLVVSIPELQV